MDSRIDRIWWVLRIGLGMGPLLGGAGQVLQSSHQLANLSESPRSTIAAHSTVNVYAHRGSNRNTGRPRSADPLYALRLIRLMVWLWCIAASLGPNGHSSILPYAISKSRWLHLPKPGFRRSGRSLWSL